MSYFENTKADIALWPVSLHPHTFVYNRTFGEKPSELSNAAWASIFPTQGGFFRHPEVSPSRATFAVFHQLHCLDGIRQAYWLLYDEAYGPNRQPEPDLPFMTSPAHIGHCIDLIRNDLICRPDTTIELKDLEIGGVIGFDSEHTCVNWQELAGWVSEWETWGQSPELQQANHGMKGHDHHGR